MVNAPKVAYAEPGSPIDFKNYVLAFFDILGQREHLRDMGSIPRNDQEKKHFEDKASITLGFVCEFRRLFNEYFASYLSTPPPEFVANLPLSERERVLESSDIEISFQGFSDTLIIYFPAINRHQRYQWRAIHSLLAACATLLPTLLSEGIPLRGAIEFGVGCSSALQEENKALVRRVMVEIPVDDWESVKKLHSPDFIYHGPHESMIMTREELGQAIANLLSAFPDFRREINDIVAEDNKVAVRMTYYGTHQGEYEGIPATGKNTASEAIVILRIVDGKIVEGWEQYDELSFRQQLVASSDNASATEVKTEKDKQDLIRLQQEWVRAELNRDAAALGRLLADEYTLTAPDGTVITRDQLISQNQSDDGFHVTSIPTDILTVQIFGNMAVVRGLVNGTDGKGKNVQSYFTDTWLKRDGRWVCVATHESGEQEIVAAEKTPGYQKMKRLIGDWTYEGHADPQWKDTPFGPTGKFKGQFQARFVLNGNFVEERWEETYEAAGALGGITIYRYDADTGNIVSKGFRSDGIQDNTVYTIEGATMMGDFKQTGADGTESLVKAVWKYGPNHDTFRSTWDLSLDEGKTWKRWLTYDAKKLKK